MNRMILAAMVLTFAANAALAFRAPDRPPQGSQILDEGTPATLTGYLSLREGQGPVPGTKQVDLIGLSNVYERVAVRHTLPVRGQGPRAPFHFVKLERLALLSTEGKDLLGSATQLGDRVWVEVTGTFTNALGTVNDVHKSLNVTSIKVRDVELPAAIPNERRLKNLARQGVQAHLREHFGSLHTVDGFPKVEVIDFMLVQVEVTYRAGITGLPRTVSYLYDALNGKVYENTQFQTF